MRSFTSRLTTASVCQFSGVRARIAGSARSILHSAGQRRQKSAQAAVGWALPVPTRCGLDTGSAARVFAGGALVTAGCGLGGDRAARVCADAIPVQASAARLAATLMMRILTRRGSIRRARDWARFTRAWRIAPTPCLSFVDDAPGLVKP